MDKSSDAIRQDQRHLHNPCPYAQKGSHCIYYCGTNCELVRFAQELDRPAEDISTNRCTCFNQSYRNENRTSAGGSGNMHTFDEASSYYQPNVIGGEDKSSNPLEIIRVVDDLLNQTSWLKQRLMLMLTSFQIKMCKCAQRTCACSSVIDNAKVNCACSFHNEPERNRAGGSQAKSHRGSNQPKAKEQQLSLPAKQNAAQVSARSKISQNGIEENRTEHSLNTPVLSATSVSITRHPTELELQVPRFEQKPGNSKTKLDPGLSPNYPNIDSIPKKDHHVIQLRNVSKQLLLIQQQIQLLRNQVARISCDTPYAKDTAHNENILEGIMSSNLIGTTEEIKQALVEIQSDCFQKLNSSFEILSQPGGKRIHEKIEREIKRLHPGFCTAINQVKVTTGEKCLDENVQHNTFDQICETNIDTQRNDGSVAKNMLIKVNKKIDEKIHKPNAEDQHRETIKLSQKLITTEGEAIKEIDNIKEQQINATNKRTIETRRCITRTKQLAGREPLKEVLLNVQITRIIDDETGEVIETTQELKTDSLMPNLEQGSTMVGHPGAVNHFCSDQGVGQSPYSIEQLDQANPFNYRNEGMLPYQDRIKAGSIAGNTVHTTQRPDLSSLSNNVASYFEILPEYELDNRRGINGSIDEDSNGNRIKMHRTYDIARNEYVNGTDLSMQNVEYKATHDRPEQPEQGIVHEDPFKLRNDQKRFGNGERDRPIKYSIPGAELKHNDATSRYRRESGACSITSKAHEATSSLKDVKNVTGEAHHNQESWQENEKRSRYNQKTDGISVERNKAAHDAGTYQSGATSKVSYQTNVSIIDQTTPNFTVTLTGPYYYQVQSELKLLTESKLDRLCAERANQRILAGAYSMPQEATVSDHYEKDSSNRSQYNPDIPSRVTRSPAKSLQSTKSEYTFASPSKKMAAKSHISTDPKFYSSETEISRPLTSEMSSSNLLSGKKSELVLQQDLRIPRYGFSPESRERTPHRNSHLARSTAQTLQPRATAGGSDFPMSSRVLEKYPDSTAGVPSSCSLSIKSVRIECIPRIIDELSGRRCPKEFFVTVVPEKVIAKALRVNIIDKQNSDVLGFFLIDADKFQLARAQGIFDDFPILYFINSSLSAVNVEDHINLMGVNQPSCYDYCPCRKKDR